jgi:hypothetical protein
MKSLYRKLLSTSILNALAAGINFLSNYIIVRTLSLKIFGEFAIFSSYLAFGSLIYIIIPPNYSVFKLQDNQAFKIHLIRFFFLSSLLFSIYALGINLLFYNDLNFLIIFIFGISTYSLNFFDIKFQASGQLRKYFLMLLIISVLKIALIIIFYFADLLQSLTDLLLVMSFVQGTILIIYFYDERKLIKNIILKPALFINTIIFIKENFKSFIPYYLNTFLKRIRENSIILIFSKVVSTETIGLFALFIKVDTFVLGLSRNIEAFFMNRENIHKHRNDFYQKAFYFAALLQILYLGVGISYMKIIANTFFWFEIFILSLLVYPHVYFLLARSELLSKYNNKESNISEGIYVFIVLIAFFISMIFQLNSIYLLLISYIIAKIGLQLFMIIKNRRKYNVQYDS